MKIKLTTSLFLAFFFQFTDASAQFSVFWGDTDLKTLNKLDVGSGSVTTLDENQSIIRSIKIDHTNQKVYWTDGGIGAINRCNFDGSNKEKILDTPNDIIGITLDEINEEIYFAIGDTGIIRKCNYDGSNLQTVLTETGDVLGIEIDKDTLFWLEEDNQVIKRSNLDGSAIELVFESSNELVDLELDPFNRQIYFGDYTEKKLKRIDYSGSQLTEIVDSCGFIKSIALDTDLGIISWINTFDNTINSTTLEGEERTEIIKIDTSDFSLSGLDILNAESVSNNNLPNTFNQILISPNPANSYLNFEFKNSSEKMDLSIYNVAGNLVETRSNYTENEIFDCSHLEAGIYFFHFHNHVSQNNQIVKVILVR